MRYIDECGYGVDASEMDTHCWRCGYERYTERCHVIPDALDGEDTPSNYRLLCPDCHIEAPNVNDPNEMDNRYGDTEYKEIIGGLKMELAAKRDELNENDTNYPHIQKVIDQHWND